MQKNRARTWTGDKEGIYSKLLVDHLAQDLCVNSFNSMDLRSTKSAIFQNGDLIAKLVSRTRIETADTTVALLDSRFVRP